jgi:hypothetical protein
VAGIRDILTKSIGTSNKHNVIHATIVALKALRSVEQVAKTAARTSATFTSAGPRRRSRASVMALKLKVTQVKSGIGRPQTQRKTLEGSACAARTVGRPRDTRRHPRHDPQGQPPRHRRVRPTEAGR